MEYNEVKGDLIKLAKEGAFDVIVHGCNCMCVQGAGVAKVMKEAFGTDKFPMERPSFKGDINKLGTIDFAFVAESPLKEFPHVIYNSVILSKPKGNPAFYVVNTYTQYNYGMNHADGDKAPFDYEAFTLCMRKINKIFSGKYIGMPKIGSHLAGGDWIRIQKIIIEELVDCRVTVVVLP